MRQALLLFWACVSCISLAFLIHQPDLEDQFEAPGSLWGVGVTNNQQPTGILAQPATTAPTSDLICPRFQASLPPNIPQPTQPPPLVATIMTPTAPVELVDNQDASPLFNIPLELRRAIYAHLVDVSAQHIHSVAASDGSSRLRFTPCIAPGASDQDELDGSERCPDPRVPGERYPIVSQIFRRRLLSSWGPHWMCEELALHPRDCGQDVLQAAVSVSSHYLSHLRVCKRM